MEKKKSKTLKAKRASKKKVSQKSQKKTTRKTKRSDSRKVTNQRTKSSRRSKTATLKDPEGGLTAAGRRYFEKKEGAHLKAGVKGKADTPEKMKRKGSFLRRHFANPRGPMVGGDGKPTRLALSAHAWGEAVPKTMAAAKKLAQKGAALLKSYHAKSESKSKAKSNSRVKSKKTS